MVVKLERYTIEQTRNINGEVLSNRYGYAISVKKHWWNKKQYLRFLYGWQHAIINDEVVKVQLVKYLHNATLFSNNEMDFSKKSVAENIIQLLKEKPNKFILS